MDKTCQSDLVDSLMNRGIATLNEKPCPTEGTIVITGLARSGTTMMAKILGAGGLELGNNLNTFLENIELSTALKKRDDSRFSEVCQSLDRQHGKWVFKQPKMIFRLNHFLGMMNNPRVVIIFRDILTISLRHEIVVGRGLLEGLTTAVNEQRHLLQQIDNCRVPLLLVSYEKALQFPHSIIKDVLDFCGETLPDERLSRLESLIVNGEEDYLSACQESREKSEGAEKDTECGGPQTSQRNRASESK